MPSPAHDLRQPGRIIKLVSTSEKRVADLGVVGLAGYQFDWPVLFRVDAPAGVPAVLGLGGVVPACQWLFDGRYTPDTPLGSLRLDDTR